jgi:hypothetical protein
MPKTKKAQAKKPKFLRTDSGDLIPVQFIKKNIRSTILLLMSDPPKKIRVRDCNKHKLVY